MKYTKENPLRCFFAFAGYNSQALSLERLQKFHPDFAYEIAGWSEIKPTAIKAHNILFPDASDKNYGEITKIDWSSVPDFDLFTMSSPCFVTGTSVLTSVGYKAIESLKVGDLVYTKEHTYRPITAIGSDGLKPIYELRASGILPIRCTSNHPFYTRKVVRVWDNAIGRYVRRLMNPSKVQYKDLVQGEDFIGIPILKDFSNLEIDSETLWLAGRYVADGHISDGRGVIISVGSKKVHDFDFVKDYHTIRKHTPSCSRVIFNKQSKLFKILSQMNFGRGAINKRIPMEILGLPVDSLKIFLDGYMSGDGCFVKNHYQATTISRQLAESLVLAVQKCYNVGCRIYFDVRPNTCNIEGRLVNQHDTYMVRWCLKPLKKSYFVEDGFVWYPIKKKSDLQTTDLIFNITVDESHTYIANNCAVFNCQDFSIAGKQAGGEEGSGTRSSLLWECKKAILAKKPKYVLFENVSAIVSQKFRQGFFKWIKWLDGQGYSSFHTVMDSKDFGVPQHRERVFMISILRTVEEPEPHYNFPKPFPLERRLKDVLLPYGTVPEEYYLSQEKVDEILVHCGRKMAEGCGFKPNFQTPDGIAGTIMAKYGSRETDTYIKEGLFGELENGAGFTPAASE